MALAKSLRPYLKNNLKTKKARGITPLVEHLPNKHKALSSNPSTTHTHTHTKMKKKKKETLSDDLLYTLRVLL
jgi:ribosomal protein RSM22 (predicted rRNA methylase)